MTDRYVSMYTLEDDEALCLTEDGEWIPEYLLDSWYSFKFEQRN